jgi:hypothetical protein
MFGRLNKAQLKNTLQQFHAKIASLIPDRKDSWHLALRLELPWASLVLHYDHFPMGQRVRASTYQNKLGQYNESVTRRYHFVSREY